MRFDTARRFQSQFFYLGDNIFTIQRSESSYLTIFHNGQDDSFHPGVEETIEQYSANGSSVNLFCCYPAHMPENLRRLHPFGELNEQMCLTVYRHKVQRKVAMLIPQPVSHQLRIRSAVEQAGEYEFVPYD